MLHDVRKVRSLYAANTATRREQIVSLLLKVDGLRKHESDHRH